MDKFNGFSQEEINKLNGLKSKKAAAPTQTSDTMKKIVRGQHGGIRRVPDTGPKTAETAKNKQGSRVSSAASTNPSIGASKSARLVTAETDDTLEECNLDRSMSKSLEEALFYPPMKPAVTPAPNGSQVPTEDSSILKLTEAGDSALSTATSTDDGGSILHLPNNANPDNGSPFTLNLESPFKGVSLKEFELQRRMIEEQNKQKKELLYRAIEHHSQKTAAEARKIEDIRTELSKLDVDLAIDVAILRKEIDSACIHFSNIEKHYLKVEAQFLKAKMELHQAAEKKELLTEHLCTVIAHNEDRKAEKLSELMEKVGLSPAGELNDGPRLAIT